MNGKAAVVNTVLLSVALAILGYLATEIRDIKPRVRNVEAKTVRVLTVLKLRGLLQPRDFYSMPMREHPQGLEDW